MFLVCDAEFADIMSLAYGLKLLHNQQALLDFLDSHLWAITIPAQIKELNLMIEYRDNPLMREMNLYPHWSNIAYCSMVTNFIVSIGYKITDIGNLMHHNRGREPIMVNKYPGVGWLHKVANWNSLNRIRL